MARYIDADLLMRKVVEEKRFFVNHEDIINNRFDIKTVYGDFAEVVASIPTAYVEEVKHAKWEINCDGYYPYCSNCKTEPKNGVMSKHCPECGAKMDERRDA